jgi:hypothetical protein
MPCVTIPNQEHTNVCRTDTTLSMIFRLKERVRPCQSAATKFRSSFPFLLLYIELFHSASAFLRTQTDLRVFKSFED